MQQQLSKKETALLVMRSSEFYAECKAAFASAFEAEVALMDALRMAVVSGGKSAYQTAFQAGVDAATEQGYAAPRQRVYSLMRNAGIVAPGKQGKRKAVEAPSVDTSQEAWVAAYRAADWPAARRIMAQLIADGKA